MHFIKHNAHHSDRALYDIKYLCLLKHCNRVFESHSSHGCVSAFALFFFSPGWVMALERAYHLSTEFYRLSVRLKFQNKLC
jgi:hypothetical protein